MPTFSSPHSTRPRLGPRPQSQKANLVREQYGVINTPDFVDPATIDNSPKVVRFKGKVRQYELLYPLLPAQDFSSAKIAFDNNTPMLVGKRKTNEYVHKSMLPDGIIIVLSFSQDTKQHWYKSE